jgi:hypothetical protein
MGLLINFLLGIVKKILTFGVVLGLIVFVWNVYKEKREARTFLSQFSNVEGLSKGAPIFSNGIEIGKVIKIFPIGNSNNVAVKGLITNESFPSPRGAVDTRIITNFKAGGGKALELRDNSYDSSIEQIGLREDDFMDENKDIKKAVNGTSMKVALRLMRDTFQMTKDFGIAILAGIDSKQTQKATREIENSVNNTITSLEYGTVEKDVKRVIEKLNDDIKDFEKKPNKEAIIEKNIKHQTTALRNTINSYANLSNTYKD